VAYRYLGNKTRLVDIIVSAVEEIAEPGARVADPMCGTAAVAQGLGAAGFVVTASDELTFPVVHARVRLQLDGTPAFEGLGGYEAALRELNASPSVSGFFHREYSDEGQPRNGSRPRAYFTGRNARRIDGIRARLSDWERGGLLDGLERDLLYHDLIMAVNRVANIAGTYGYYRRTWNSAALRPLELMPSDPSLGSPHHSVMQGRVEDLVAQLDVEVLYLDPPYTKRQYAGNYHLLETLAVGDEPDPVGEGGLRDWYDQYSAFCSKRQVRTAFHEVISRTPAQWVLLSYSEDGLVPPHDLVALLEEFGSVRRQDVQVPRYRSNGGAARPVTEQLYRVELA
jgi:adenine-specific DNA-methyltransferase